MNFDFSPEFKKDLERLQKRWPSLPDDIEFVKPRIESLYVERDDVDIMQHRTDFFTGKTATILSLSKDGSKVIKMRLDVASLDTSSQTQVTLVAVASDILVRFIELHANDHARHTNAEHDY